MLFLLATVALVSGSVLALGDADASANAAYQPELWVAAPMCALLFLALLRSARFLRAAKVLIVATGVVVVHGRLGLAFFSSLTQEGGALSLPPLAIWAVLVTAVSMMMFRGAAGRALGLTLFGITSLMVVGFLLAASTDVSSQLAAEMLSEYVVGHGAIVSLLLLYGQVERALQAERRRADEQQELARTDPLTQLRNRRVGTVLLERIIARRHRGDAKQFAIIMFDIDHFKRVNDEHGHHIGDRVLVEVATLVCKLTRPWDTVCRWGGEEFLVIVSDADASRGRAIAERIRSHVAQLEIEGAPEVTASFGFTSVLDSDTRVALLERVDEHLYAAKEGGRDCVHPTKETTTVSAMTPASAASH